MLAPDPDLPLWLDLQGGNDAALEALMGRHKESIFRFIFRYVQNEEDARDLLQETFVRAYFKRHQFQPRARISTWLYRIALNLCRDHARSRAGKQQVRTESLVTLSDKGDERERDIGSGGATPAEAAQTKEALVNLDRAIQSLPHDLKTALILVTLENKSQKECADLLNISVKAVETRVYRARKLLETRLATLRTR